MFMFVVDVFRGHFPPSGLLDVFVVSCFGGVSFVAQEVAQIYVHWLSRPV